MEEKTKIQFLKKFMAVFRCGKILKNQPGNAKMKQSGIIGYSVEKNEKGVLP